mmetsp:Transcript_20253/g.60197  ORF Transcript_20253/g.60197 Transcript_20253/m.60197 type:complete len:747 (+) Transcript_20253:1381-3621(+)
MERRSYSAAFSDWCNTSGGTSPRVGSCVGAGRASGSVEPVPLSALAPFAASKSLGVDSASSEPPALWRSHSESAPRIDQDSSLGNVVRMEHSAPMACSAATRRSSIMSLAFSTRASSLECGRPRAHTTDGPSPSQAHVASAVPSTNHLELLVSPRRRAQVAKAHELRSQGGRFPCLRQGGAASAGADALVKSAPSSVPQRNSSTRWVPVQSQDSPGELAAAAAGPAARASAASARQASIESVVAPLHTSSVVELAVGTPPVPSAPPSPPGRPHPQESPAATTAGAASDQQSAVESCDAVGAEPGDAGAVDAAGGSGACDQTPASGSSPSVGGGSSDSALSGGGTTDGQQSSSSHGAGLARHASPRLLAVPGRFDALAVETSAPDEAPQEALANEALANGALTNEAPTDAGATSEGLTNKAPNDARLPANQCTDNDSPVRGRSPAAAGPPVAPSATGRVASAEHAAGALEARADSSAAGAAHVTLSMPPHPSVSSLDGGGAASAVSSGGERSAAVRPALRGPWRSRSPTSVGGLGRASRDGGGARSDGRHGSRDGAAGAGRRCSKDMRRGSFGCSSGGGGSPTRLLKRRSSKHLASTANLAMPTELDPETAATVRNVFRLLDFDCSNVLRADEIAYFAHHVGKLPQRYAEILDRQEGILVTEFAEICIAMITKHGQQRFDRLIHSLVGSLEEQHRRKQAYWQGIANAIDDNWSRVLIPCLYTAGIVLLFVGRLPDDDVHTGIGWMPG